ncbi:response regulator transcription factor [Flavobacterium caeni]|uniref:Two component transcriptional regulator, LuxR family n=1 Tax=Flavobacterium caeni TaxID=490189 RepID=A0A1G5ALK5_9FLAO|nr:response regulator transcription factor [Flavobacterium caeni]SCX78700.1 two component transcriptional regulator, LuxR family [Flavobacterium caeni]
MKTKLRIFIVDDHPLVSEGFKTLLRQHPDAEVVGSAENAFDAIGFLKNNPVDIAFLDINLPDINGIELCAKITAEFPDVKCLALTTFNDRSYISRMIQSGARGYLLKNASREDLFKAIDEVAGDNLFFNVDYSKPTESRFTEKPVLTRREQEVLREIAEGYTNQEIAERLYIGVTTVSTHRQNLMLKLESKNTAALIKAAAKLDLI